MVLPRGDKISLGAGRLLFRKQGDEWEDEE